MMNTCRFVARALVTCLITGSVALPAAAFSQPQVGVGLGEYFATPADFEVPSNNQGQPVAPRVSGSFDQPVQANDWWSSLIWNRSGGAYGSAFHPQPLSLQGVDSGLEVVHRPTPFVAGSGYNHGFAAPAFTMGASGVSNATMAVDGYGDWHVEASWTSGANAFAATIARGSPYVYARAASARIQRAFQTSIVSDLGNVIVLQRDGVFYGLFAPPGTDWNLSGFTLTNNLGSVDAYSVAVLPNGSPETVTRFAEHAFAFVTDTRVSWAYSPENASADVTYEFVTEAVVGDETTPLVTLYRHQRLNSFLITEPGYSTSRGEMRLAEAGSFLCRFPFRGVLPGLADAGAIDAGTLGNLVDEVASNPRPGFPTDTYFQGKTFGRAATALTLAEQAGRLDLRDSILGYLRGAISEWLSIGPVDDPNCTGNTAYDLNQAEDFDDASDVEVLGLPSGITVVAEIGGGDFLRFNDVDFSGGTPTALVVNVDGTSFFPGEISVRIDALDGPLIAEGTVGAGDDNDFPDTTLAVVPSDIAQISGVHDIFFVVDADVTGEILRFDAWRFTGGPPCSPGGAPDLDQAFSYNDQWDTVVGRPASFNLGNELNDHHFHYGYFIHGAAEIARRDPAWASPEQYGGMVELLIRDTANWDRSGTMFPFLRNFEPYRGHGYASGHADFFRGNNQEASSESLNFSQAVVLWGAVTGNTEIRDLGIFLHATEAAAVQQYWFDADQAVFPPGVQNDITGILWDDGAEYATFFSAEPELIQGINQLPLTGGHLYLGDRPDAIVRNYDVLEQINGGQPEFWNSLLWSALALGDPERALAFITSNPGYEVELGDSRARSEFWIRTLAETGPIALGVTADWPHAVAFEKNGVRTYNVFNPTQTVRRVRFSDGTEFDVQPGDFRAFTAEDAATPCAADINGDGQLGADDFNAWLNAFLTGDPVADQNNDGQLGADDFNTWLNGFLQGCP
ncbi:MAG: glycosyl hydrolase [Planctomycetota bacterium]